MMSTQTDNDSPSLPSWWVDEILRAEALLNSTATQPRIANFIRYAQRYIIPKISIYREILRSQAPKQLQTQPKLLPVLVKMKLANIFQQNGKVTSDQIIEFSAIRKTKTIHELTIYNTILNPTMQVLQLMEQNLQKISIIVNYLHADNLFDNLYSLIFILSQQQRLRRQTKISVVVIGKLMGECWKLILMQFYFQRDFILLIIEQKQKIEQIHTRSPVLIRIQEILFQNLFIMDTDSKIDMEYRHLGPTGLKVSVISFGNWVNSNTKQAQKLTTDCVKKAWDLGINFFDTAEVYGYGEAQVQFGNALRQLNVPRHHLVISTKLFWGAPNNQPNRSGLSRKHIIEGTKDSLKRLGLDYVDVMFCHRPDYDTPMEQTCRAFDWAIRKGYILYWGTSEWNAEDIAQAHMVCQKYGLIKPVVEQPEYNLFIRNKVQFTYRHLFGSNKLGSTVWSPLASGILTGKYNNGIPEGSRFDKNPQLKVFMAKYLNQKNKEKTLKMLNDFEAIAKQLGCSMAQLAMAWVINNPDVSTAITGATKVEQLEDTVKAIAVRRKFTPEIEKRIEQIFRTAPAGKVDMPKGIIHKSRRFTLLGYTPDPETQTK